MNDFAAPVLRIYSKSDEIVPASQSERMHRALKRPGKDAELLKLDGDDHYLSFGETPTQALKATVVLLTSIYKLLALVSPGTEIH